MACANVGDYVWFDADGDGIQDADETPLPNIDVYLLSEDGTLLSVMETDANGIYMFTCLVPGRYQVVVNVYDPDLPPGLTLSTVGWYVVDLEPNETYLDADFGFAPIVGGLCDCPPYLLFESERDRQVEIYKLWPPDGSDPLNLTRNTATDREAARSSDGRWIAFQTTRHGPWQIYIVSEDGLVQQRITDVNAHTTDPQWAPDCGHAILAYQSDELGNWDIHVYDLGTRQDQRLTDNRADDVNPNWTPDGTEITFETNRDGRWQIYIMDADGSNQRPLFTMAGDVRNPVSSFDGSRLAFESNRYGRWQVYVFERASGQIINVSVGPGTDVNPAWSPDSARIAFQSDRNGSWDIYVVNADGSNLVCLAHQWTDETAPAWSCDGHEVYFQAQNLQWRWDVYAVNSTDGSGRHRLTVHPAFDGIPIWCMPENDHRRPFGLWGPPSGRGFRVD